MAPNIVVGDVWRVKRFLYNIISHQGRYLNVSIDLDTKFVISELPGQSNAYWTEIIVEDGTTRLTKSDLIYANAEKID